MDYTKIYNDRLEGLFIVDTKNLIRFSIVAAKENSTNIFKIVVPIIQELDREPESAHKMLSMEVLKHLHPSDFEQLVGLVVDPETAEGAKRIACSLKEGSGDTLGVVPGLMSMAKRSFSEFESMIRESGIEPLYDRLEKIRISRMW